MTGKLLMMILASNSSVVVPIAPVPRAILSIYDVLWYNVVVYHLHDRQKLELWRKQTV